MPSLAKAEERWLLIVLCASTSRSAIWPLVSPMDTRARTCRSRWEKAGGSTQTRSSRGTTDWPLATASTETASVASSSGSKTIASAPASIARRTPVAGRWAARRRRSPLARFEARRRRRIAMSCAESTSQARITIAAASTSSSVISAGATSRNACLPPFCASAAAIRLRTSGSSAVTSKCGRTVFTSARRVGSVSVVTSKERSRRPCSCASFVRIRASNATVQLLVVASGVGPSGRSPAARTAV